MRICLFVDTFAYQCIIDICDRYNLDFDRDLFALQSVRIAPAVITLMMPSADLHGQLHQLFILINTDVFQDRLSDDRVLFHLIKLFRCQSARFIEDLVINADLADVMQCRSRRDQRTPLCRYLIFIRLLYQTLQKQF